MTLENFVDHTFLETFPEKLPGYQLRQGQLAYAQLVTQGLLTEKHVIAEAGTGIGKSFGYLIPVIGYIQRTEKRVVVSTGTIALQEQLFFRDLPFLLEILGLSLEYTLAKGKQNYLCRRHLDEGLMQQELFQIDLMEQIVSWVRSTLTGDKDELPVVPGQLWENLKVDENCTGNKCFYQHNCFYLQARKKWEQCNLVICTHHLFFSDLKIRLETPGSAAILPEYDVVVFDEAQHLEDTARLALGHEVSNYQIARLGRQIRKAMFFQELAPEEAKTIADTLNLLEKENREAFKSFAIQRKVPSRFSLPVPDLKIDRLIQLLTGLAKKLQNPTTAEFVNAEDTQRQKLADQVETLKNKLDMISGEPQEGNINWAEVEWHQNREAKVTLRANPIAVADLLANNLFQVTAPVVITSATIGTNGTFQYVKNRLGLATDLELSVPSPFNYRDQCLLYLPTNLPFPHESGYNQAMVPVIKEILEKTQGRAFVLFTSVKALEEVHQLLAPSLPWTVYKQGENSKRVLLENFKSDIHSVLFATASFWEGVDVQGESLSCVIIDRLPFAVPTDPVSQARAQLIRAGRGNDFWELFLPEAILKLKQGFGRLIRTNQDRGVVAILDKRVTMKTYGQHFLNTLPRCRTIQSLEVLDHFLT